MRERLTSDPAEELVRYILRPRLEGEIERRLIVKHTLNYCFKAAFSRGFFVSGVLRAGAGGLGQEQKGSEQQACRGDCGAGSDGHDASWGHAV